MNPTRAQLITLALIASALLLLWLIVDWAYNRGRSDLYAMTLQLRVTTDSVFRLCPALGGH